jgi:hypothetical protein
MQYGFFAGELGRATSKPGQAVCMPCDGPAHLRHHCPNQQALCREALCVCTREPTLPALSVCAAGWLTREDMTVSLYPQLSIIAMQSVLLFMFWNTIIHMEDQLVALNKVIENSPHHAKASVQTRWGCKGAEQPDTTIAPQGAAGLSTTVASPCSCSWRSKTSFELPPSVLVLPALTLQDLITHCTVVTEEQFKDALQDVYKRKRRFRHTSWDDKNKAGDALHNNCEPPTVENKKTVHADFFDLEGLRNKQVVVRPALSRCGGQTQHAIRGGSCGLCWAVQTGCLASCEHHPTRLLCCPAGKEEDGWTALLSEQPRHPGSQAGVEPHLCSLLCPHLPVVRAHVPLAQVSMHQSPAGADGLRPPSAHCCHVSQVSCCTNPASALMLGAVL